jgi:hypothetical protein
MNKEEIMQTTETRDRVDTMRRPIAGAGDYDEKSFVSEVSGMLGLVLTEGELDMVLECHRRRLPSTFSVREIRRARGLPAI